MQIYTYSEARQRLAMVLEQAENTRKENRTLPALQPLLHFAGKNMLFDNRDHLPGPFCLGIVQAVIGMRPPCTANLPG